MRHLSATIIYPLLTGLLCGSCSSPSSESAAHTTTAPVKYTTSVKVDSLNGIPGHRFGETLSSFPGLKEEESIIVGMRRYCYPSGQSGRGYGWFGKHADQLTTSYYFVDGKFAYFISTAYGTESSLLRDEATYLFGKGERYKLNGLFWQGKLARAIYTQSFTAEGPSIQLEVVSEPLEAIQKQQQAARLQADNDNR